MLKFMCQFSVSWYNPSKNLYDNNYTPTNYLTIHKCRLTSAYNYSNYLDTELSLSQLHSYIKGHDLVNNLFSKEIVNWISSFNNAVSFSKYKTLVDKVSVK